MLFNDSGTELIECDAPAYSVVRACRSVGFRSPEDVRWNHLSGPTARRKRRRFWDLRFLQWLFGKRRPRSVCCVCGQMRPKLVNCTFVLKTGERVPLDIGQCAHCHTISWRRA